jgi:RNA polymerase sigma-70 factor (ECF subfamily)
MTGPNEFEDLVARVRAGDAAAAGTLVRRYEPAIRRFVRMRLRGSRLTGLFDSMDVCQSVMGSFFLRAAAGQYAIDTPTDLIKLLTAIARNKLAFQVRRQRAQKRDVNRNEHLGTDGHVLPSPDATPSQEYVAIDLLGELRKRLTAEERQIVELRTEGREWTEIAEAMAGSPEALRKKHARALDRVAKELGLEGDL